MLEPTKLYNIKVITELKAIHNKQIKMLKKVQVVQHQSYYRIESNSQRLSAERLRKLCCTTSKLLQNWKQFTTRGRRNKGRAQLYNIKVITELKAIHNYWGENNHQGGVVQHQSYYRIESNSQPSVIVFASRVGCTTSKLLQNWKQFTTARRRADPPARLYNIKVITELKAIHNCRSSKTHERIVVQHQSYYRIESNSQRFVWGSEWECCCTTSKLLQNWKQFTTGFFELLALPRLYNIKVITELKAIHNEGLDAVLTEGLYNIKVITELKAIHNGWRCINRNTRVVQHQSYYRIESNSQPAVCETSATWVVQHQSYYRIESNSQH